MIPDTPQAFKFSRTALAILIASVLLGIILGISTVRNLNREQLLMEDFLKREALTLVHSFEAGARTSMIHCRYGDDPLAMLVTETVRKGNIAYIRIIEDGGRIVAGAGELPATNPHPAIAKILSTKAALLTTLNRQSDIFEVVSEFKPVSPPHDPDEITPQCTYDCCSQNISSYSPNNRQVIFIGLKTGEFIEARHNDIKHSVFMGLILFLLGSAGLYFIFLYQEVRVTKTTLANMELYTENVFNSMPTGLLTMDRKGRLVAFNHQAEVLTGLKFANTQGQNLAQMLPLWPSSITAGQADLRNLQFDCIRKDGSQVPVKISSSPLRGSDGKELGAVLIFQDMSQIKEMEVRLERARRLAAMGKMAAGIAHEIRNPLGTLKGFAQYFQAQANDDSESRKYAEIMIGEVDRLSYTISALLQFARPREPEIETLSAQTVMERAVRLLEADFKKQGIEPKIVNKDKLNFAADPDLILQALLNLLKNSLSATPPGGHITLAARKYNNDFSLIVEDSGKGMSVEEQERMFDPFFTTRKTGTGLGLAVSHQIIEQHNGRFEVESSPEQGTRIVIILPQKIEEV